MTAFWQIPAETQSPGPIQCPLELAFAAQPSAYLLSRCLRGVGLKPFPTEQAALHGHRAASNYTTKVARCC